MRRVSICEPLWLTTLPHLVKPLQDEWLAGLLLRFDEINHWDSGMTYHFLKSYSPTSYSGLKKNFLIYPPELFLDRSSHLLAIDRDKLLATTYRKQINSIFGSFGVSFKQLTPNFSFQLCPECIAQHRLVRRIFVIPQIKCCPEHQAFLMKICQCGVPLQIFPQYMRPFSCYNCNLDWAKLPRLQAPPIQRRLEQRYLSYFEFFFKEHRLNQHIFFCAVELLTERLMVKDKGRWCYLKPSQIVPLSFLVDALVRFDISLEEILYRTNESLLETTRKRTRYDLCHSSLVSLLEKGRF